MKQRQETYKKALEAYGLEAQLNQLQEECAELIVAVNKLRRNQSVETENALIDELADVKIMVEQISFAICAELVIDERVKFKIDRLNKRLAQ